MYPVYEASRTYLADEAKRRTAEAFREAQSRAESSTVIWTEQVRHLTRVTEDYMRRGYLRYDHMLNSWQSVGDHSRVSAYIRQLAKEMHRPFITVAVSGYFRVDMPTRNYLAPIMAPLIMLSQVPDIGEYKLEVTKLSDRTIFTAGTLTPYRVDKPTPSELPLIKAWIERLDTDPVWRAAMRANTPFR